MKTFALAVTTATALIAMSGVASARQTVPKSQTYCLESTMGPSGALMNNCMFSTMAQCIASKTAQGDQCSLNPVLAFQKRYGKNYGKNRNYYNDPWNSSWGSTWR
jgi:uncharacterized protein DUF3551